MLNVHFHLYQRRIFLFSLVLLKILQRFIAASPTALHSNSALISSISNKQLTVQTISKTNNNVSFGFTPKSKTNISLSAQHFFNSNKTLHSVPAATKWTNDGIPEEDKNHNIFEEIKKDLLIEFKTSKYEIKDLNINLVLNLLKKTKKENKLELGKKLIFALCVADKLKLFKNLIEKIEKEGNDIKKNQMGNNAKFLRELLLDFDQNKNEKIKKNKKSIEEELLKIQIRTTLALLHTDFYNILLNIGDIEGNFDKKEIENDIKEIKNKLEEGFNIASKISKLLKEMLTVFPNIFIHQRSMSMPIKLNINPRKNWDETGMY